METDKEGKIEKGTGGSFLECPHCMNESEGKMCNNCGICIKCS